MSILVGIELQGSTVSLQAIDRRGTVRAEVQEPVSVPFHQWWGLHPDERVRSVRAVLQHTLQEGKIRPSAVSAIGISCEPSLVLVDAEMEPYPPRALNWQDLTVEQANPAEVLRSTLASYPSILRSLHSVFDLQDWLRYRWTGAVATSTAFAWNSGLSSPHSPGQRWNAELLQQLGLESDQVPPLMPGPHRIGTLQEELVRETGLPRGTWFCAGTTPQAARLWLAAEPRPGQGIVLLEPNGATLWRVGGEPKPSDSVDQVLPSPYGDHWYHREAVEVADPRRGETPIADVVYDAASIDPEQTWSVDRDEMVVSADFGCLSRAPALLAGVGLGWYRDMRPMWRKRCRCETLQSWIDRFTDELGTSDVETREQT
ncbi:MAG: FGGY family carbohydrate kinase [Planctomycetota bacterium]|nr:FGGY family carbohydrate kinase [Planctomycetota bacterium]